MPWVRVGNRCGPGRVAERAPLSGVRVTGLYLGVDPGKKGGLVWLQKNGAIEQLTPMPLLGGEIDANKLRELLIEKTPELVVMEKVHSWPTDTPMTAFRFGWGAGMLEGIFAALCIPYLLVSPPTWQKIMLQGVVETKDTKARALIAAKRLYPSENFTPPRCRVAHDGLVDAILIARYIIHTGARTPG